MNVQIPSPRATADSAKPSTRNREVVARWVPAVGWVTLYVLLVAFPLLVLLSGPMTAGGGFAWDFAMALGLGGLAIMSLQFVLTARFRRATAPFGIDIIYYFHRWAAISGAALLLAHYLILRIGYEPALGDANPLQAPAHMTAGRLALLLFGVLIVSSLWRKKMHVGYDRWRLGHGVMALAAVVLSVVHIEGVGNLTRLALQEAVWMGYSATWLFVLGYIRIWKPLRLLRHPYRVVDVREERGSSWTLTLEPTQPPRLAFRPGQFAWLTLGTSPFRAKEHPFSFSGSADDSGKLRFTIKELGDFTRTIKRVRVGELAYVDGPHGVFTTDHYPQAPRYVLIAGGVGIAPMMSILRTLAERGDPRPLHLIYGNGHWDRVLFREELNELERRLKLTVVHVVQEAPTGWTGETGFITEAVLRKTLPPGATDAVYFLCGPKPMTDFVLPSLRRLKVPLHRIHLELFEMA